jgi:hypothetical protein
MAEAARPLGVHLRVLQALFEQVPEQQRNGCTAEQVFQLVIQPATQASQSSYLSLLLQSLGASQTQNQGNGKSENHALAGPATCYMVHPWGCKFAAVLDSAQQFDQRYPDTFFWLDLTCSNHHTPSELSDEWWTSAFRQHIRAVGHVVVVISPITDPLLLQRAWCLFELFTAMCMKLPLSFIIASAERDQFKDAMLGGDVRPALQLLQRLKTFDSQQTGTRVQPHSQGISRAVSTLQGGFGTFTQTVRNALHRWAVQVIVDVAMEPTAAEAIDALEHLAHELDTQAGERAGAVAILKRCLALRKAETSEASLEVAKIHLLLGRMLNSADQLDGAFSHITEAICVQEAVLGPMHRDLAWPHLVLVDLCEKRKTGGDELVVKHATRALAILQASLGQHNPTTAGALVALGNAHLRLGDVDAAQRVFEEELVIRTAIDVPNYSNLARVCEARRDLRGSLRFYLKDLDVKIETYGDACVLTQVAYLNAGHAHQLLDEKEKAQECLERSKAIRAAGAVAPHVARAQTTRRRVWRTACLVALWLLGPALQLRAG